MMDSVTLENFRCFRERQTVRLAPLTLLVGENSTGKTSFLAMLRILSRLQEGETSIDFKEPPYDLGSFDEIAHNRGGRGGRAAEFTIGSERRVRSALHLQPNEHRVVFTFQKGGSAPRLFRQTRSVDQVLVEEELSSEGQYCVTMRNDEGAWTLATTKEQYRHTTFGYYRLLLSRPHRTRRARGDLDAPPRPAPVDGSPEWQDTYADQFMRAGMSPRIPRFREIDVFASAPVRSQPRRTYDPARLDPDPDGDYVPMYLADLSSKQGREWRTLKGHLDSFGQTAGLFDEISVRQLGRAGSGDPFQIQVRKGDGRRKGAMRNLADVGYGVSQVLPVITELLRHGAPYQFLLQQPEVHLHPSAQAALGSLLCDVAATGQQLVVETHSDHLIDRVRMDVRDGATKLKPEDVSLLYFERNGLDVCVHSLRFDELGNVLDAPPGYRQFFMQEVERSIWPPK